MHRDITLLLYMVSYILGTNVTNDITREVVSSWLMVCQTVLNAVLCCVPEFLSSCHTSQIIYVIIYVICDHALSFASFLYNVCVMSTSFSSGTHCLAYISCTNSFVTASSVLLLIRYACIWVNCCCHVWLCLIIYLYISICHGVCSYHLKFIHVVSDCIVSYYSPHLGDWSVL